MRTLSVSRTVSFAAIWPDGQVRFVQCWQLMEKDAETLNNL